MYCPREDSRLRSIIIFITILLSWNLWAQNQDQNQNIQDSQTILATERQLDAEIVRLNTRLRSHAKLLLMKVKVLPAQTVLYKGKAKGDRCISSADQEASDNNCIHLEVYDFVGSELVGRDRSRGAKNKAMELFFAGESGIEKDPRKIPPRDITKIFSRVYVWDYKREDTVVSEITDEAPGNQPLRNNQFFLFYQKDGFPFSGTPENPSQKGVGRYNLEVVENTISFDIRNNFKKEFYIKHLDSFDKLYTKIYSFNDRDGNQNYNNNVRILRDSLKY